MNSVWSTNSLKVSLLESIQIYVQLKNCIGLQQNVHFKFLEIRKEEKMPGIYIWQEIKGILIDMTFVLPITIGG